MARSPRPSKPIESFGPELFRALIEGAKREITFDLPYRKAIHFQQRINQLRNQMRLQSHEQYAIASQAKVTISWPPETEIRRTSKNVKFPKDIETICTITIKPADSEFAEVLKNAGVIVPSLGEPLKNSEGTKVEDDILSSYVKES